MPTRGAPPAAKLTGVILRRFVRRPRPTSRACAGGALLTVAVLGGCLMTAGAGARDSLPRATHRPAPRQAPPAGQPLAVLLGDHVVRAAPSATAPRIGAVGARRPLTHVRTTLPVLGAATAPGGGAWVHVRLPGRPNGHAGWISADRIR